MAKRKTFEPGQQVEVQREVGAAWESATYEERLFYVRGWHNTIIGDLLHAVPARRIRPARKETQVAHAKVASKAFLKALAGTAGSKRTTSPPGVRVQPRSKPNAGPAIVDLVLADIKARDVLGARKYGTRLQAHNGRDALVDAYQEALDLAIYLRQAIEERGRK